MNKGFLGAAAALLACATSASAAIVTTTFTGAVSWVADPDGMFGNPLVGDAFTARFVYDTAQDAGALYSPGYNYAYGGTVYGPEPFVVSAVATINGVATPILPINYGKLFGYDDGSLSEQYRIGEYFYDDCVTYIDAYLYAYVYSYVSKIPSDITRDFSYDVEPGDVAYAGIEVFTYNFVTGVQQVDYVVATVSNVTNAVPEPPIWAMMAIGFAGFGVVRRLSRRRVTAIEGEGGPVAQGVALAAAGAANAAGRNGPARKCQFLGR